MKLWLILDAENYTPAMESVDPTFVNSLGLENLFWNKRILTSITETGRLHSSIFKGCMRHTVSLYRLRNYREYHFHGINLEKIDAFVDALTADYLMKYVDMIYVIRKEGKHGWRYGRFDFPQEYAMLDATEWHHRGEHYIRIERWTKTSD